MRIFGKIVALFPLVVGYLLTSVGTGLLPVKRRAKRALFIKNTSFFARLSLGLLGIRVLVKNRERLRRSGKGRLLVSNHLSYIDVPVIASIMPAVFITSVELKNTMFIGLLAHYGGSLFVERRSAAGLKREIHGISRALHEGFSVVLFPEATTSNGDTVRPFKNSLFNAAIESTSDVLPVCLRYTKLDGEAMGHKNRDRIYYYGGMSFFTHLFRLLSHASVEVELVPLKALKPRSGLTRKELAALAHEAVCAAYHQGRVS